MSRQIRRKARGGFVAMYLTGFADEVSQNIEDQIKVTKELGWKFY